MALVAAVRAYPTRARRRVGSSAPPAARFARPRRAESLVNLAATRPVGEALPLRVPSRGHDTTAADNSLPPSIGRTPATAQAVRPGYPAETGRILGVSAPCVA